MRRPQKTFTVEVKRGRKNAPTKILGGETPKIDAAAAREPFKPNPPPAAVVLESQPAPPRRILEAIEPPPPSLFATAPDAATIDSVVATTTIRRRGRPPKPANSVGEGETSRVEAAVKAKPRSRPLQKVPPVEGAVVVAAAPAKVAQQARVSHGDRAEAAGNLPRGERWKRRLPKVLW